MKSCHFLAISSMIEAGRDQSPLGLWLGAPEARSPHFPPGVSGAPSVSLWMLHACWRSNDLVLDNAGDGVRTNLCRHRVITSRQRSRRRQVYRPPTQARTKPERCRAIKSASAEMKRPTSDRLGSSKVGSVYRTGPCLLLSGSIILSQSREMADFSI